MTNEAVIVELLGDRGNVIDYTIADASTAEKGTIMMLKDPRTCSGANVAAQVLAGIAASEKVLSDGQVNLGCYTYGIFDMVASGAVTVGNSVMSAADANYPNTVCETTATTSGAAILGYALEEAADTEVFEVLVKIGG